MRPKRPHGPALYSARARAAMPCQSPAVRGRKRCSMHGGANPGAPTGNRNAWKHGARSCDTMTIAGWLLARNLSEA
ncbi:HGGxSTG domain-containing protein [Thalassobaculum salexigens]|uniref:HGGxSTG domain-containing protein n=1 Tax=Thalassobaculum salexigens TaxID=455360 RepID=UPI00248E05D4|nr:HGGxSTG domain-containing protein [Thalassobaculum salexigens]